MRIHWKKGSRLFRAAHLETWLRFSRAAARQLENSVTKCRPATSELISEWPRRWLISRSAAGETVFWACCTGKAAMPWSFTQIRKWGRGAGRRNGRESFEAGCHNFVTLARAMRLQSFAVFAKT